MRSMSTWRGPPVGAPSRAGATAAPLEVTAKFWTGGGSTGTCGSGSRMSAPSPLPKAFSVIEDDLLSKICVSLGPAAVNVVKNDGLAETGRLRKANIARNYRLKDLSAEETAQISGNLARKRGPLVIHRQKNAFDLEFRVECASNPHQRIKKLGNAFESQILTLDRYEHRAGGNERIQG